MAPTALVESLGELAKRQFYGGGYNSCPRGSYRRGNACYRNSSWTNWGRWVAMVLIILFFIFVFFVLSCLNARKRRKRGMQPLRYTGWTAMQGKNAYNSNNNNAYNNGYNNTGVAGAEPVPPYSPPHNNAQNYNQNDGYYGQQSGIELQQPQNAYAPPGQGGSNVYAPPPGPPPTKTYGNDGVIR